MVNIIIYLKKGHDPKELVKYLITEKLIASASIDENNISYELVDAVVSEVMCSVITSQSKALLFNQIVKVVEEKIGEGTPINSTPIIGSNKIFDHIIRTRTIQV